MDPHLKSVLPLNIAVKANDTIGENDLVPYKLVFGVKPCSPIINSELPNQNIRMIFFSRKQIWR